MRRAQLYGDRQAMQNAQNAPRPNCKKLDDLTHAAGGWSTLTDSALRFFKADSCV